MALKLNTHWIIKK